MDATEDAETSDPYEASDDDDDGAHCLCICMRVRVNVCGCVRMCGLSATGERQAASN